MKKIISCFVLLFVVTAVAEADEHRKMQTQSQIGRYQIIPVEYNSLNLNGENVKKAVLKIDTLTGDTWILNEAVFKTKDGKKIDTRGWEQLERYLETKDNIVIKHKGIID